MEEEYEFYFDEILKELRNSKKLTGKGRLEAEIEPYIVDDVLSGEKNRCNGVNKKLLKAPVTVRLSWKLPKRP